MTKEELLKTIEEAWNSKEFIEIMTTMYKDARKELEKSVMNMAQEKDVEDMTIKEAKEIARTFTIKILEMQLTNIKKEVIND